MPTNIYWTKNEKVFYYNTCLHFVWSCLQNTLKERISWTRCIKVKWYSTNIYHWNLFFHCYIHGSLSAMWDTYWYDTIWQTFERYVSQWIAQLTEILNLCFVQLTALKLCMWVYEVLYTDSIDGQNEVRQSCMYLTWNHYAFTGEVEIKIAEDSNKITATPDD